MKNKLAINFCGINFDNPLFLPSGIIMDIASHKIAVAAGYGGVILKSVTVEKRDGNPIPRVVKFASGYINSVGLKNPGIKAARKEITKFIKTTKTPIIVSVFAAHISDFQKLVAEVSELKPVAIELNLSCPNVGDEFGNVLASQQEASFAVMNAVRKEAGKIPVICKLAPNVPDIGVIAAACEVAGADAISAINAVAHGMVIDIKTRRPVLGMKKGGVTGPAIKPIAVAKIYEIYEAVKIPIMGIGGVSSWEDAVELMMAGATLVGVGSAVYFKGYKVVKEILEGMNLFLKEEKLGSINDLVGAAHKT